MRIIAGLTFWICFMGLSAFAYAQPEPPTLDIYTFPSDTATESRATAPIIEPEAPDFHPVDKQVWKEETEGVSYIEQSEEPKEIEAPKNVSVDPEPLLSSGLLKIVAFILVAALLAFIIYRMFGKGFLANPKVAPTITEITSDLDERPMESDLDTYLRQALESGNYKLAIRIYYLMILRSLQEKRYIQWKKEKTNHDYLRELHKHPEITKLSNSTLIFEYVWYGDAPIGEHEFQSVQPGFRSLIDQINKS